MLNTILFVLALPALLGRPSFVLSQPHFLAQFGDFTPVGAVGDYPLDVLSKDKYTIYDKVVNKKYSSVFSMDAAMRLGAKKDGVVFSSPFAAGDAHTCAQEYQGPFYCWGSNGNGQLGDGTTVNKNSPTVVRLGDGETVEQVAGGGSHTCLINTSGSLYCMGSNSKGELGDGTTVDRHIPTLIQLGDGETAVQVTAGNSHTCVINDSGELYCMGWNDCGQLGDGTTTQRNIPALIKLGDGETAVQVAAGYAHTCVINNSGALYCMGYNYLGGLGDGTTVDRHIPTLIQLGDDSIVVQVTAGYCYTCVINNNGALYCMGQNYYGSLGDGTTTQRNIPTLSKLGDGETAVQVSAGSFRTCLINNSGALYCTGGLGYIPTIIQLGDDENAVHVVSSSDYQCVLKDLKDIGGLVCWGGNSSGQLGNGANTVESTATNANVIMKIQTSKTPTVKPTKQNSDKPSLVMSDQPSKISTVEPTKKHSEYPSSGSPYKTYKLRLSVCSV